MRFKFGAIPNSGDFIPDEQWKSLREPSPWLTQLVALPLGGMGFVISGMLWLGLTNLNYAQLESDSFLLTGLLLFVPLIVVHEFIHALAHPQLGLSTGSTIGFWPSKLLFYAHYDGERSCRRFVAILGMPLIMLTILPLMVSIATGLTNGFIAWISTWNALFACVDVFGIILLYIQVPPDAICRNQGWKTYWRQH